MTNDITSKLDEVKTYSQEEAIKDSLNYFKGDKLAAEVFISKYAMKDSNGNLYESNPDQMHRRLAKEIARIESKYKNPLTEDQIYNSLKDFKYIVPQGGPMTGIGNNHQIVSLSNCFVIGKENDSYGGIMKVDEEQVQLMKRRGGVGHDLSHIRPKGSPVLNSALTSTGVVPFMERYSNSTREVAQDGRRGALMLSLSINHPDAAEFIDAKLEKGKITGANISVKIDDDFMKAVESNSEYVQKFPVNSNNPKYENKIKAKTLWDKIIHNAWKSAEPGILFWDTIEKESVPDSYADLGYKTISTNPCGEIPLCPYDSCRLIALNLYEHVENPFTQDAKFNFDKFKENIKYTQRIMDDIIDLEVEKIDGILNKINFDPEEEEVKRTERILWEKIKHKTIEGRRTGIGITAEGDMLAALNFRYGTKEASDFAEEVHKNLALSAYSSSVELARERGPFEIYDSKREENNPFIQRLAKEDPLMYEEMKKHGRRNIALLTIAPTGTTSLMTQTTSGLEPVFLPAYNRKRKINPESKVEGKEYIKDEVGDLWEEYNVLHPKFKIWMEKNGIDLNKDYSQEELESIVEKSPYYKATSNDIDWLEKVRMQGRIQKWVDHSISVTINLPKDVDEELVSNLYMEAWKSGCKGVTVYREGSRDGVMKSKKENKLEQKLEIDFPQKRPDELNASVIRFINQNGKSEKWTAFVGEFENKPYEIFTGRDDPEDFHVPNYVDNGKIIKTLDKKGIKRYDFSYENKYGDEVVLPGISHAFDKEFHNYAILVSAILRSKTPVEKVIDVVSGLKFDDENINTWKSGVARALKKYVPNGTEAKDMCPSCLEKGVKTKLQYQEGCLTCSCCGTSKCG